MEAKRLVKECFSLGEGALHVLDPETRRSLCTRACPQQVYSADDPRAVVREVEFGASPEAQDVGEICGRCYKELFAQKRGWKPRLEAMRRSHDQARIGRRPRGSWLR